MQQFLAPETFEFFARYLLAGFVIYSVRGYYIVGERPKQTEILFEVLVLSLINQALLLVTGPVFGWIATQIHIPANGMAARIGFFTEILIQPALLGLLLGLNLSRGWNEAILRRLSMPVVQPTRRAYDHLFGEQMGEAFLVVTFDDGEVVYGYFGERSFAGSDRESGDLLLENIYSLSENGDWVLANPPRAALVRLDNVRSIEVISPESLNSEGS